MKAVDWCMKVKRDLILSFAYPVIIEKFGGYSDLLIATPRGHTNTFKYSCNGRYCGRPTIKYKENSQRRIIVRFNVRKRYPKYRARIATKIGQQIKLQGIVQLPTVVLLKT